MSKIKGVLIMKARCDKCKHEFEPEQEIEKVKGDIRRVYFICPKCGKKYIAYYLSSSIENKQLREKKLIEKMKKCYLNTREHDKYLKEYKDLAREIKKDMQNLKKRFEKS